MKKLLTALLVMIAMSAGAQTAADAKMKTFIDALMKKMTLEEKIGQLNLLNPGGGIGVDANQPVRAPIRIVLFDHAHA